MGMCWGTFVIVTRLTCLTQLWLLPLAHPTSFPLCLPLLCPVMDLLAPLTAKMAGRRKPKAWASKLCFRNFLVMSQMLCIVFFLQSIIGLGPDFFTRDVADISVHWSWWKKTTKLINEICHLDISPDTNNVIMQQFHIFNIQILCLVALVSITTKLLQPRGWFMLEGGYCYCVQHQHFITTYICDTGLQSTTGKPSLTTW